MAYNVPTNGIKPDWLYIIIGDKSVTYNSVTYATGETFRGVAGVATFTYGSGTTEEVNEVTEISGFGVEFEKFISENIGLFPDDVKVTGFGVEYVQSGSDLIIPDATVIRGFGVEYEINPLRHYRVIRRI